MSVFFLSFHYTIDPFQTIASIKNKKNYYILLHLTVYRSDPATWATTWMSGIALAVLVISLISGAIFALYWARKNKRNMKASYPGMNHNKKKSGTINLIFIYNVSLPKAGPILTANQTLVDKQHTLWLHGNTLLKPMHSVNVPDANLSSEYAEVAQIMPKSSVQPEPYATVS